MFTDIPKAGEYGIEQVSIFIDFGPKAKDIIRTTLIFFSRSLNYDPDISAFLTGCNLDCYLVSCKAVYLLKSFFQPQRKESVLKCVNGVSPIVAIFACLELTQNASFTLFAHVLQISLEKLSHTVSQI